MPKFKVGDYVACNYDNGWRFEGRVVAAWTTVITIENHIAPKDWSKEGSQSTHFTRYATLIDEFDAWAAEVRREHKAKAKIPSR